MSEARSRSWWSTALVSFATSPFGGFLWIGAGKWAVVSLAILTAAILYFCYFGFPILPTDPETVDLLGLVRYGFGFLAIVLVVPFAKRFTRGKWYAHGLSVFLLAFALPLAAAFLVRSLLLQPFSMPSLSMVPTLEEGDHFFVSKFAYGYSRYSVPFGLLPIEGRILDRRPQRGDIVVFKGSGHPQFDYVKRVVGLPGETIQMIGGVLHINGKAVELEDISAYA